MKIMMLFELLLSVTPYPVLAMFRGRLSDRFNHSIDAQIELIMGCHE